jgi:branched-chain amino acid transport system substrate-binding protein
VKKQHLLLLSILALVSVLIYWLLRPQGETQIKIGAILPLTGEASQYGQNDREGIDLAISEYHKRKKPEQPNIAVLYEDCGTDPTKAVSAFRKLRGEGVSMIVDNAISSISLALAPLLEKENTVLISTGASNPGLSGISPYFFRVWNSDAFEGKVIADHLKKTSPQAKLAIIAINTDYGKGLENVVKNELDGSQISLVKVERFAKDSSDFRALILSVLQERPSHIYLIGYASQNGPCVKQLREGGYAGAIVGTVAMEDALFLKLAGASAEGVVYPYPVQPSGQATNDFVSAFQKHYTKDPQILNDCGYDATNLLIKAIESGARDGATIASFLEKMAPHSGASGEIKFNKGDVSKPMEMKSIREGAFQRLK